MKRERKTWNVQLGKSVFGIKNQTKIFLNWDSNLNRSSRSTVLNEIKNTFYDLNVQRLSVFSANSSDICFFFTITLIKTHTESLLLNTSYTLLTMTKWIFLYHMIECRKFTETYFFITYIILNCKMFDCLKDKFALYSFFFLCLCMPKNDANFGLRQKSTTVSLSLQCYLQTNNIWYFTLRYSFYAIVQFIVSTDFHILLYLNSSSKKNTNTHPKFKQKIEQIEEDNESIHITHTYTHASIAWVHSFGNRCHMVYFASFPLRWDYSTSHSIFAQYINIYRHCRRRGYNGVTSNTRLLLLNVSYANHSGYISFLFLSSF